MSRRSSARKRLAAAEEYRTLLISASDQVGEIQSHAPARLIQLNRGTLEIESQPTHGTTVTLTLPQE